MTESYIKYIHPARLRHCVTKVVLPGGISDGATDGMAVVGASVGATVGAHVVTFHGDSLSFCAAVAKTMSQITPIKPNRTQQMALPTAARPTRPARREDDTKSLCQL